MVHGVLKNEAYQGALIRYEIEASGQTLIAEVQNTPGGPALTRGESLTIGWPVETTSVLVD